MKKDIKPFLFFSIIASLLVGHLANRTALIFEGLTGNLVENINAAVLYRRYFAQSYGNCREKHS